MSMSKEYQYYHLTPRGWEEGTFIGDVFGGKKEIPIPEDRYLTILCIDELTAPNAKPIFRDQIEWKSDNLEMVRQLQDKFGVKPDWFGYRT